MFSSGTQHVMIEGGRIAGSVRFDSMHVPPALGHRLKLQMHISLDPNPELGLYALTDIDGELSTEAGAIGRLHWHGNRPDISCKPHTADHPFALVLDLDRWVLDRIEAHRNGGEPGFKLDLWPKLEREDGRRVRVWIQSFPIPISREAWNRILDQLGYGRYDLVELRIPPDCAADMLAVIEFLRKAEAQLQMGAWFEAIQQARFVCETLEAVVKPLSIADLLKTHLDGNRGEYWAGIVSRLKGITASSHHSFGQNTRVLRAEARGVVRSAASLAEIISAIRASVAPICD
jgi:hypothetical protein